MKREKVYCLKQAKPENLNKFYVVEFYLFSHVNKPLTRSIYLILAQEMYSY